MQQRSKSASLSKTRPAVRRPGVLFVDDKPSELGARKIALKVYCDVTVKHPSRVESKDLDCDLILADFRLEDWPSRDELSEIALVPADGLALIGILRSQLKNSNPAFALHTGVLPTAAQKIPAHREHEKAALLNLEWAFSKGERSDLPSLTIRIASLATAVYRLPSRWHFSSETIQPQLDSLLALSQSLWYDAAVKDMWECFPPTSEQSESSHGLFFLRWMLHRILPYPCFLLDKHYLAAKLRISLSSLDRILENRPSILRPYEYDGILSGFLGRRWWKAGIEHLLWTMTKKNPGNPEIVVSALSRHARMRLQAVKSKFPVVGLDADLRPLTEPIDLDHAIRLQPDGWPPYAEPAWTTLVRAKDSAILRALTFIADRPKLND